MEINKDLIEKPIPGLIRPIAVPASVGFLFNTLYNVVDTFFGGRISTDALAAMSLSFPVFFVVIAVGSGISTGATALIANSLGAGDLRKARYYSIQAISFSLILSLILTVFGLALSPYLFKILGAQDNYLALALAYTNVIFYGTVFFLLSFILNAILTSEGNTRTYRNLLIMGFFLNIGLDPWFIYGGFGFPALGLSGVAWSTILIQLITAVFLFLKVIKTNLFCRECLKMIRPKISYYLEIAKQGFPASLNMLTVAIGIFVITFFISQYGREAVAAYGIATRLDQIALLPMIGLTVAALTLVGQNNGAKFFGRVKKIINLSLQYGYYITALGIVGIFLFSWPLMNFFSRDPQVVEIGAYYLKISVLIYFAYAILFIVTSSLQGLKKPYYAIWIGLYRQIAAPLIIFWFMTQALGWRLKGIWWGIFIINWSAAVFTLFYLKIALKKLK